MASYISDIRYNDFRRQIMTVEEIVGKWEQYGGSRFPISSDHSYSEQRSRIIETLLIGMPQQPIFVDDTEYEWNVIDGEERVKAYFEFCTGRLKLTSLYFKMNQYEGKTINDLSLLAQKNILSAEITVNVLNPGLSRQERFGVYVCLKPRLDSDTLSACRKRIYVPNYWEIVNLAKTIQQGLSIERRTSVLEKDICHLLVAIDYQSSYYQENRYHIDVAANAILERENFQRFFSLYADQIEEALRKTLAERKKSRYSIFKQGVDYLNALTFMWGSVDEEWLAEELKRLQNEKKLQPNVNSAEQFYRVLGILLNNH